MSGPRKGAEARSGARGVPFGALAGGAVALHVVLGLLLYEPTLFPGGDNAGYMILGEALRTGQGFRDLYLPGAPLHTKYPPVYPALLALLGWLGGVQVFKLASLGLTAGSVWLTARLGRRLAGPAVGAAAAVLLALNPVLLEYSHWVLSEAPFVFLTLLALVLVTDPRSGAAAGERDGAVDGPRPGADRREADGEAGPGTWRFAAGVAAAVVGFLTRTAGLPLLVAIAAAEALERRWRRAAGSAAAGIVAMGGWAAFQRLGPPEQAGYLRELVLRNPYDPSAGTVGAAGMLERTLTNFWTYVSDVLPAALTGWDGAGGGIALGVVGLLLAGLAFAGWIQRSLRALEAPELFLVLYVGLISVWPEVWTDRRFLLPAVPLLLIYAGLASVRLGRRLRRAGVTAGRAADARRPTTVGTAGLFALGLVVGLPAALDSAGRIPERIECLASYRAGAPCDPPALASFYAAARWAGESVPPDAVVANRKPRLFYWHARRQGDIYRYSPEPALVIGGLEEMGADYVVVDRVSGTTLRYLVPAIRDYRDRFQLVYRGGEPVTLVLRFLPPPGTALRPPGARDGPADAGP